MGNIIRTDDYCRDVADMRLFFYIYNNQIILLTACQLRNHIKANFPPVSLTAWDLFKWTLPQENQARAKGKTRAYFVGGTWHNNAIIMIIYITKIPALKNIMNPKDKKKKSSTKRKVFNCYTKSFTRCNVSNIKHVLKLFYKFIIFHNWIAMSLTS